jgi:5'-phosphate synthase pdxT subunit
MQIGIISMPDHLLPDHFWGDKEVTTIQVTGPGQVVSVDALVLAGTDIFALQRLLMSTGLLEPVLTQVKKGIPIWGINAGLYLMAKHKSDSSLSSLDVMDVTAGREGLEGKFSVSLYIQAFGFEPVTAVFNNPAYITQVEPHVGIMAYCRGRIIMARQGNMLASSFFTEEGETRPFNYFLQMIEENFD